MGNPNARPKKASVNTTKSTQSSRMSNVSTLSTGPLSSAPTTSHQSQMAAINATLVNRQVIEGLSSLAIASPTVVERPELKFKSFKCGNLITPNFLPPGESLKHTVPIQPLPVTPKNLRATPTSGNVTASGPVKGRGKPQNDPHNVQGGNRQVQTPPSGGVPRGKLTPAQPLGVQHRTRGDLTNVPIDPHAPLRQPVPRLRHTKTFLTRRDKTRRDIVVRANGVERNMTQIVEQHFTTGSPVQKSFNDWTPDKYDFISDFKSMKKEQQLKVLDNHQVEILVEVKADTGKKHGAMAKKTVAPSIANVVKGVEIGAEETKDTAPGTTVIHQLEKLGLAFTQNTKNLTVTFDCLAGASEEVQAVSQTRPKPTAASQSITQANIGPLPSGPDYEFVKDLVANQISNFRALEVLTIVIQVRTDVNTMPISTKQLALVLPFYNLPFKWVLQCKMNYMTRTVPVHGWCMKWLREENKRIRVEEERIRHMALVQNSMARRLFPNPA